MRHRVAGFKLGRDTEHRRAMRRNLAAALFTHGQITTTLAKAKSVKPFVEKLISAARKGDLASRRRVIAQLQDRIVVKGEDDVDVKRNKYGELIGGPRLVKQLFDELASRYADRPGGYTRIIRLGRHRIGDGSSLCVLQLVSDSDSGPQVSGQYSRRRNKADRRMKFAAQLRRQQGQEPSSSATAVAEPQTPPESAPVTGAADPESTADD